MIESSVVAQGLEILNNSSKERIQLLVKMLFNTSDKFNEGEYVYKKARVDNARYCTKENSEIIKSKTLLLEEKSIPRTEKNKKLLKIEHLQSIYKGKIKIVSEDELKEAIKNKVGLYLHTKEEVSFTAFSVIDLEKSEIIYAGRGTRDTNFMNMFEVMLEELSSSIF